MEAEPPAQAIDLAQEYILPFSLDTIWSVEELSGMEIKDFKGNLKNFPPEYMQIIEKGCECSEETVMSVYNWLLEGRQGPLKFKTIVKYLVVSKQLEKEIIDKSYYKLFIDISKKLIPIEKFEVRGFAVLVISKALNHFETEPPFNELIECYQFLSKLADVLESRHNFKSELYDLVSPIKLFLMKAMEDRSPDNVKNVISMIILAEEYSADLNNFKENYKIDISEWIKWGILPQDFDSSNLDVKAKLKGFEEYPEEVPEILIEEEEPEDVIFEHAQKVKPLYMTHQEIVQVSVWMAKKENGEIIALKECVGPNVKSLAGYIEENKILKFLSGKSKNFLKYYGSEVKSEVLGEVTKQILTIHMEYVETTLKSDKLERDQKNKQYNEFEIVSIYKQLIVSFNLLRDLNILHCDIKPSNIMITKDLVIKIIDFNSAKKGIDELTMQTSAVGTKDFMSPEMRKGLEDKTGAMIKEDKADVFSLGMTILYLVTNVPLVDLNLEDNRKKLGGIIASIKYEWLKNILSQMLEFDYYRRPGLKDLISHFSKDLTQTQEV